MKLKTDWTQDYLLGRRIKEDIHYGNNEGDGWHDVFQPTPY